MMQKNFLFGLLLIFLCAVAKGQSLTGKITDTGGNPVSDAFVYVLNTNLSSFTDAQGNFSFKNIPAGIYTFSVSAVGYATTTKNLQVNNTFNQLNVQLADASGKLDEVVVSAEKKEESLQNIPISITSISSQQVQQYRLWNSKELTAIVPNLFSNNSGDERNVTSIRGITTTSYDPAIATYIDGVNQFSLDTYIANLLDIERIEVLRGPQGTLYGRNAMGGVINIITAQPTNATSGFVEIDAGNYKLQRYSAGLRTALIKDKLYFGASGVFNKRNGFYTNQFNNTSFDKQKGTTGNYYLKFIPNARWAITLNVKHQNNQNNGAFPLVNGIDEAFNNAFFLSQDALSQMRDNTLNASLSVNYVGVGYNFTSQTAWQSNHRYYKAPLDGDFSPLDAVTIINDYGNDWNKVKVLTQELRFTSPANKKSPLKWTTGTYFFHQYIPGKQATHFGKDAGLLGVPDTDFATINTIKGRNTGIAVYGQVNYAVNKKLELIAGVRYDYENKKLNVKGEYQKDGEMAFVTQPDTSAVVHYNAISPKFGLSYLLSVNNNLFVTYSRGYRTGGLTQLSSDPSQPPLYSYKPEYSNNIEAGIKNNIFNTRLRLNITAFITHVTNAQVPTLILPEAITVTKNTGKLTSKGLEFELSATPAGGLKIDYNFGYTDATYKSLKISQNGEAVDLNGKKQIFTPDVTSMLALQYNYILNKKQQIRLVARGEWFYLGEQYFDLSNNIRQSPYNLLNTRIGISSNHIDLFFWGRNLSNKKYIAYAYDFGAIHLGEPKTYGGTLLFKF